MKPLASGRLRISALQRLLRFSMLGLLLAPGLGLAAEPPSRIRLVMPDSLAPGETGRIVVELRGETGQPAAATQDLRIEIRGMKALPPQVTIPAGSSRVEVPVRPPKADVWQIEASAKGLFPDEQTMICKEKSASSKDKPSQNALPPAPPGEQGGQVEIIPAVVGPGLTGAGPTLPGRVKLIAQPSKVRRVRGRWETSRVEAFWFQGVAPAEAPSRGATPSP